jgi:hypothetical protein
VKQTAKQTAQPKPLRFKPGESIAFELNEKYEALAIAQARDPHFVWKHSLAERLALAAYLKAKQSGRR